MMLIIALMIVTALALFGGIGVLVYAPHNAPNFLIAGANLALAFTSALCSAVLLFI